MKEFDAFHSSPKRQREWLLGRIAAKDAVRGWVALKTGCKELHPASFSLVKNVEGAPMVASLPLKDAGRPFVSVTHSQGRGMAVAHDTPVGIDLERIEQRDGAFLELFATLEERELLKDHLSRDFHEWTTRLWSAKEAASKVVGGSITKTPHKYRLSSVNGEGAMTVRDLQEGVELVVRTYRQDDRVVALARK